MLKIRVRVYNSHEAYASGEKPFRDYVMDHNDDKQRRVLGEQCRNIFEGGQLVITHPVTGKE